MTTFAIQHGATLLCSWDLESGTACFHENAVQCDGMLVLQETEKVEFVLGPAVQNQEHRILIGDVPLDSGDVLQVAGKVFWGKEGHFESARARTPVRLQTRREDATSDEWKDALVGYVYIIPSKLGEDRYFGMTEEIQAVSRSLLVDLFGKSTRTFDLRLAGERGAFQSREQELGAIEAVVDRLGGLLGAIGARPKSRVHTVRWAERYWGGERLSSCAVKEIARRGQGPNADDRPLIIPGQRREETFDTAEHRFLKAFLELLIRRARFCAKVARGHIRAISSERNLRNTRVTDAPTIYESVDLPKIRRLEHAVRKAGQSAALASEMSRLPFLHGVKPEFTPPSGGWFQQSPEYRAVLSLIRDFLLANAVRYEGDEFLEVTKLTSKLFEQWCYIRTVNAFRECGLEFTEWDDALRENLSSRFVLDFDRGLTFEGALGPMFRVRIEYEPWILCQASAADSGRTLCRGGDSEVAWCPDILVECLRRADSRWEPEYGIALDCKYTSRLRAAHWNDKSKYLQIRSTATGRQIVKQLWLIAPGRTPAIQSMDPAVRFTDAGPSCAREDTVQFQLDVVPKAIGEDPTESGRADPFRMFARGTVNFLRRELAYHAPPTS